MEPSTNYFSPLHLARSKADLDLGLEYLYKLESIGINEGADSGSIDEEKVKQFANSISFSDGSYHVELPWYEDRVAAVPSNHKIALATLYKVYSSLQRKGLEERYNDVFVQQLQDGIIEKVDISPSDYEKYIFIPHRPVVKEADQITTKLRVVYNCSLKVGADSSLNEASYPGIDLMNSLFQLLCSFRSNKYVILADVKQAFLQIKLKLEADKNRFCFFWLDGGRLVTYRYTTIVFGLSSSPFILNYVIKHHAKQYPNDVSNYVLNNHFYVDNLIYTHSDPSLLNKIYKVKTKV